MIYLKNISDAQVLMIPRNGEGVTGDLTLIVTSTIDLVKHSIIVHDLGTSEHYFHLSAVVPEGSANGEYQYELLDGSTLLSSGLLIIGSPQNPYQYEKTITYQQYESE